MWPQVTASHCSEISPQTPASAHWGAPSLSKSKPLNVGVQHKASTWISSTWTLYTKPLEKQVALTKNRIAMQKKGRIIVLVRWEFIIRPNQVYTQERVVTIIWVIQPSSLLSTCTSTNVALEPLRYSSRNIVRESIRSKRILLQEKFN